MCRVFFVILIAFLSNTGFAQKSFSLQQCIDSATANNISLKQSDVLVQSAGLTWRQSKANLFPNLNASVDQGINQGRSIDPFTNGFVNQQVLYSGYGISSNVILFNGLSLQNNIRQNAFSYEASKMELQQAKDNLTLSVILAYLQVLTNEDLLAEAVQQSEVGKKQWERLKILDQQGAISPSQLSDVKGEWMNSELAIIDNKNALETSKLTLAQLMNIRYDSSMQLTRIGADEMLAIYPSTANAIYEKALEQLALVKAVALRKKSAEIAVKALKGTLYPSLVLGGNVNTNYSSAATQTILLNTTDVATNNYVVLNGSQVPVMSKQSNYASEKIRYVNQLNNNIFSSINIGIRVPIFNSLQTKFRIKQARLQVKNTELIEENTKLQLRQQIDQAYLNMTNALQRYNTLQQQVAAYTESFKAAEVRFNAGVGTSIDYIIAKNNLDRATINLISTKYNFVFRKKVLDYYNVVK